MRVIPDNEINKMTKDELIFEHNYQVFKSQEMLDSALTLRMILGFGFGIIFGLMISAVIL